MELIKIFSPIAIFSLGILSKWLYDRYILKRQFKKDSLFKFYSPFYFYLSKLERSINDKNLPLAEKIATDINSLVFDNYTYIKLTDEPGIMGFIFAFPKIKAPNKVGGICLYYLHKVKNSTIITLCELREQLNLDDAGEVRSHLISKLLSNEELSKLKLEAEQNLGVKLP